MVFGIDIRSFPQLIQYIRQASVSPREPAGVTISQLEINMVASLWK